MVFPVVVHVRYLGKHLQKLKQNVGRCVIWKCGISIPEQESAGISGRKDDSKRQDGSSRQEEGFGVYLSSGGYVDAFLLERQTKGNNRRREFPLLSFADDLQL